jgi:hypothetical protein
MLDCAPISDPCGLSPCSGIDPEGEGASQLFTLRLATMADAEPTAQLINASLYGGDRSVGRDANRLGPRRNPAVRRAIGRAVLEASEKAAARAGFGAAILHATQAGSRSTGRADTAKPLAAGMAAFLS